MIDDSLKRNFIESIVLTYLCACSYLWSEKMYNTPNNQRDKRYFQLTSIFDELHYLFNIQLCIQGVLLEVLSAAVCIYFKLSSFYVLTLRITDHNYNPTQQDNYCIGTACCPTFCIRWPAHLIYYGSKVLPSCGTVYL